MSVSQDKSSRTAMCGPRTVGVKVYKRCGVSYNQRGAKRCSTGRRYTGQIEVLEQIGRADQATLSCV